MARRETVVHTCDLHDGDFTDGVETVAGPDGRTFLKVAPEALELLAETAMHDIAHSLRPAHLQQLRNILDDPEASPNRRRCC